MLIFRTTVCGALVTTLSFALLGCSLDKQSASGLQASVNQATQTLNGQASNRSETSDNIKKIIDSSESAVDGSKGVSDIEALKAQLQQQQQRLQSMNDEQQALQELLKRQSLTLQIFAGNNANGGRSGQATASTAYVAFLADQSQFTEIETLAAKEISVIPNRDSNTKITIPAEAKFVAIKVGLRYTKKRSQLLIPLSSIDFETPLSINIGACDVNIAAGIDPELSADFTTKLKYYQQPLVSCS